MGKGDTYRRVNKEAYDRNWDRAFAEAKTVKEKERNRNDTKGKNGPYRDDTG